jgi:hypothetical protein
VIEEYVGIRPDDALRHVVRLREKEPYPERQRELHVGAAEGISRRHDVEHRELLDALGMIQRHAIRATSAAIMPSDVEPVETQLAHHRDLIACHRPLRIGLVVALGGRLAAVAIPPQVCDHDGEVLGQSRSDLVPHHVCLRDAVQQEDRRALATAPHPNHRLTGVDHHVREAVKHPARSALGCRQRAPSTDQWC